MDISLVRRGAEIPAVLRFRLLQALARWGVREETLLMVLSVVIGPLAGAAVWVFEKALFFITNGYCLPVTQRLHATTGNLWLLPLVPAAGGLAIVGVRWLFRAER